MEDDLIKEIIKPKAKKVKDLLPKAAHGIDIAAKHPKEFEENDFILFEGMDLPNKPPLWSTYDATCSPTTSNIDREQESNLIRIDLDLAAKELVKNKYGDINEDSDLFLESYDEFYDLLFNLKG